MTDFLDVPHFEQSDEGYCLPACARMVLAHLKIERTEAEMAQLLGTQRFGTPNFAIQKLATWGFKVDFRFWKVPELLSILAQAQPMIVFVQTGFLDYYEEDFAHAIVVIGATDKQQFWLNDPAQSTAPLLVSLDGQRAAWAEFDYQGAVVQLMPQKRSALNRALVWLWQRLTGKKGTKRER